MANNEQAVEDKDPVDTDEESRRFRAVDLDELRRAISREGPITPQRQHELARELVEAGHTRESRERQNRARASRR